MDTNKTHHRKRKKRFEYDVALSFAEENRPFVDIVAQHLKKKGLRIFYDKDALIDAWGEDLRDHLDAVYRKRARFCVIFLSEEYKKKRWTQYEQVHALARDFFMENEPYILPFRLDKAESPGLTDTKGYLSLDTHDDKQLVDAIVEKLNKPISRPMPERVKWTFRNKLWITTPVVIMGICIAFQFVDRNTLENGSKKKKHKENQKVYKGAVCMDSTISSSQGSGTCSHHGGVARYLDSIEYYKALEQSRR